MQKRASFGSNFSILLQINQSAILYALCCVECLKTANLCTCNRSWMRRHQSNHVFCTKCLPIPGLWWLRRHAKPVYWLEGVLFRCLLELHKQSRLSPDTRLDFRRFDSKNRNRLVGFSKNKNSRSFAMLHSPNKIWVSRLVILLMNGVFKCVKRVRYPMRYSRIFIQISSSLFTCWVSAGCEAISGFGVSKNIRNKYSRTLRYAVQADLLLNFQIEMQI